MLKKSAKVVVRLHVRKINVVIFTPESADTVLGSSVSLSVRFSIQDEAMDVARSAPQGAHHYHADVIYLPTVFISQWTTHSCILYQLCVPVGRHGIVGFVSFRLNQNDGYSTTLRDNQ